MDIRTCTKYHREPSWYCTGSESDLRCSELWYPSVLDNYLLLESGGGFMPCEPASIGEGHFDCGGNYEGGGPPSVLTIETRCSETAQGVHCDSRWYPGAMSLNGADLYFLIIEGTDHVCVDEQPFGLDEDNCYRWQGGNPRASVNFETPE